MFFTYILQSLKDDGYYFGHSNDIQKRLQEHNSGKTKSIKHRIPFKLIYSEHFNTRSEAYQRELFFKSFEGRQWLYSQQIIKP